LPNTPWVAPESFAILDDPANNLVGQAAEGTLFLHGINDLTPAQQRNLLGQASKLEHYHTRLICSSSKPLARMVAEGSFDARCFPAVRPIQLRVPNLREHPQDVPELAKLVLDRCVEAKEVPPRQLSTGALNALRVYDWPGNLAELESVVKSTALLAFGAEVGVVDVNNALSRLEAPLGRALGALPLDLALREARDAFERVYFEYHISREAANMSRVAERVGLERTHLYRKLKQLGIAAAARLASRRVLARPTYNCAFTLHQPLRPKRALHTTPTMATRQELANAVRALAMDAVQKANSGHPGMPMGMADIAEVLWNHHLRFNPSNPAWPDRDRFLLSNGHGSMLQYALLHLTGFDLPMEQIERFASCTRTRPAIRSTG
jgi:hypothetical protein